MNASIRKTNVENSRRQAIKFVTRQELHKFLGLMIANRISTNKRGEDMWNLDSSDDGTNIMSAVMLKFDPNAYMTLTRFRKIKQYMKWM
jgi:hypothetical protein